MTLDLGIVERITQTIHLVRGELARKLDSLERRYVSQFKAVFEAIRSLMNPPIPKKKPIEFHKTY